MYLCRFEKKMGLKYLDRYWVNFNGLIDGTHHFEFEINNKFFEFFEVSEIKEGAFQIEVGLHKQPRTLLFEFHIVGSAKIMCDRCLDFFNQPIDQRYKQIVKLGEKNAEISEDTMMIPEAEHKINLSQLFYEYIHLSLPVQRIHPTDKKGKNKCNPEMVKKLEELKKQEKNKSTEVDERWEKLKNIQLN